MPKIVDDFHKRTEQITLTFSPLEMKWLDIMCDHFSISRTDLVRTALYIADEGPTIFESAMSSATEKGLLTRKRGNR